MMNVKYLPFYLLYFIPSALIVLSLWYFLVDGTLYYCSDKVPLIDFIPPFVHVGYGDRFIASPIFVYAIWIVLIIVGIAAPLLLTKRIIREVNTQLSSKLRKHGKHEK